MRDLRKWKERPAEMVEWLLVAKWMVLFDGVTCLQDNVLEYAAVGGVSPMNGWAVNLSGDVFGADDEFCIFGSEDDDAGIRAASLAIINSKPVWRTPDGYDLILGRWPTDEELERHTEWTGHIGVVTPRLRSHTLKWRRDVGQDAPLYLVPLRPDGLPGILGGE